MNTAFAPTSLAIAAVLFHGFWEGTLIVGAVWLGLRVLPKLGAATRYAIWLCALAAVLLTAIATVCVSARPLSEPAIDATITAQPSIVSRTRVVQTPVNTAYAKPRKSPLGVVRKSSAPVPRKSQITIPQNFAIGVALLWMLVACMRIIRLGFDARKLAAIRRTASLWSSAHEYPVFMSQCAEAPLALGFFRKAVILPASIVEQLRGDAIETIILHEIAHLRRYDVWTNAFARIIAAFFALNPAAWFIMRRLSMEREIACDDWVVAQIGCGDDFANVLAGLACQIRPRAPLAAPSAIGSRHAMLVRIEHLLDARPRRLHLSFSALGGTLMLLALIALIMQSLSPVLAYEPPQPNVGNRSEVGAAAGCAVPDRPIQMEFRPLGRHSAGSPDSVHLPNASKVAARFGASNVTTFDLTVDAAGTPRKLVVVSAPRYPGAAEYVRRFFMAMTYSPATHNCVPITATVRAAMPYRAPEPNTGSVITPVYADGWSAAHPAACKVPTVSHGRYRSGFVAPTAYTEMLPTFPDAMKHMSADAKFTTSVRVHVNAGGAATSAAIARSSGRDAFDNATLAAAREATYPLTTTSCKPSPTEYVWTTTFGMQIFP